MSPERLIVIDEQVLADLAHWVRMEPRIALRIVELIEHTTRDTFGGIGKPEPLKYRSGDYGSRRITREHRLVYLVRADRVIFLQARFHY